MVPKHCAQCGLVLECHQSQKQVTLANKRKRDYKPVALAAETADLDSLDSWHNRDHSLVHNEGLAVVVVGIVVAVAVVAVVVVAVVVVGRSTGTC